MTRNKLIRAFLTEYPQLAKQMQTTNHSSESGINPYHGENSIWTHTMMVLTYIDCQPLPEPDKTILLYTGLLHDIGKVDACKYNEAKDRYSFHNHESYSFFKAYDIIDKLHQYVPCPDKQLTLKLVALHGQFIEDSDFKHLLYQFRLADKNGAVRSEEAMLADEAKVDQYEEPRYYTPKHTPTKTCTMLCGLPNTGKSTYIANNKFDYTISRDRCIEELYIQKYENSANYNTMYDIITNNHKDELDKYFKKSIQEARCHDHIAIDMTMLSLKARRSMMYDLPGYSFSCILFTRSLEATKQPSPGKVISESVYNYIIPTFTYPQTQEGFTSITIKDFQ